MIKYRARNNKNIAIIKCKRPKPSQTDVADLDSRSAWLSQTSHQSRVGKFICRNGPEGLSWQERLPLTIACPTAGESGSWSSFYTPNCTETQIWNRFSKACEEPVEPTVELPTSEATTDSTTTTPVTEEFCLLKASQAHDKGLNWLTDLSYIEDITCECARLIMETEEGQRWTAEEFDTFDKNTFKVCGFNFNEQETACLNNFTAQAEAGTNNNFDEVLQILECDCYNTVIDAYAKVDSVTVNKNDFMEETCNPPEPEKPEFIPTQEEKDTCTQTLFDMLVAGHTALEGLEEAGCVCFLVLQHTDANNTIQNSADIIPHMEQFCIDDEVYQNLK